MKTLYIVRHAKSSWEYDGIEDIDRPLKKRGINDAYLVSTVLQKKIETNNSFSEYNGLVRDELVGFSGAQVNKHISNYENMYDSRPGDLLKWGTVEVFRTLFSDLNKYDFDKRDLAFAKDIFNDVKMLYIITAAAKKNEELVEKFNNVEFKVDDFLNK